jgi:hypothetical protein
MRRAAIALEHLVGDVRSTLAILTLITSGHERPFYAAGVLSL